MNTHLYPEIVTFFPDTVDNYHQSSKTMHNASLTNRISEENSDRTAAPIYPPQQTNNTISQQPSAAAQQQQSTQQTHRLHDNELKRQSEGSGLHLTLSTIFH